MTNETKKRFTVFPGSGGAFGDALGPQASNDVENMNTKLLRPATPTVDKSSKSKLPSKLSLVNVTSRLSIPIRKESPWRHYRNAYGLDLGGLVAIVCKTPASTKLFIMKKISGTHCEKKIDMIRKLKHEHILHVEEVFAFEDIFYVISEHACVSLDETSLVCPSEVQLAAIVHQVLDVVLFLTSQNLTHGSIIGSNVLLTRTGVVKIGKGHISLPRHLLTDRLS